MLIVACCVFQTSRYDCSWGWNGDGQLGHGDFANRTTPALVESIGEETPICKVPPTMPACCYLALTEGIR